jgi:hypothetical protein
MALGGRGHSLPKSALDPSRTFGKVERQAIFCYIGHSISPAEVRLERRARGTETSSSASGR